MKKIGISLMTLVFVLMTMTSCSKNCQDCTGCNVDANNTEFCEDDYGSELLFDAAILVLEADGCACS